MSWPLRRLVLLAMLVGGLALSAAAQGPGAKKGESDKKAEPARDKDAGKAKADKLKLPPGSVIVGDPDKALALWPDVPLAILRLDRYQEILDRLAALEKQLKSEKTTAHSCEMTGRLDGDYVGLQGEFVFATREPRTTVILGLQGGQLSEKADLDGQTPLFDYSADEGFTVRVEAPGNHRLVLHLRVPVASKRPAAGGGPERGFDLGLPGTVITTLALELPPAVKEVRWNETLEKNRVQGKWFFALGQKKSVSVAWREPVPQAGGGPQLTADGAVKLRLGEKNAELGIVLTLVDPRGQTKECRLVLPPHADVKVEAPPGLAYELVPPGPKDVGPLLKFTTPNAEPWAVTALASVPQPPGGRLAVGPFFVVGAQSQRGTITVLAPPGLLQKQRVLYHRHGEVFQRDPPKGSDVEAVFQYWGLPDPGKVKPPAARVPLEVELKSEHGPLEATAEQVLKLRPSGDGWEVELTEFLQVKSPGGGETIEMQLPRPRPFGPAALALTPLAPFPAILPWPGLGLLSGPPPAAWAIPVEFQIGEEGGGSLDMTPPDAYGRCRVVLPRGAGKGLTLVLTGRYAVAPRSQRVRVGLPRVLNLTERGGKITVQADEAVELLVGPRGLEEPVPERHRYQFSAGEAPAFLDLAWRAFRPEFPVDAVFDVTLRGRTAQVHERLTFGPPPRPGPSQLPRQGQVQLQVPAGVHGLALVKGDRRIPLRPEKGSVWVGPDSDGPRELALEYFLTLPAPPDEGGRGAARVVEVHGIWPQRATHLRANLRVWCEPGTRVRRAGADDAAAAWLDRGVEPVAGRDALPALVLHGEGARLPLTLRLDEAPGGGAALACDRALIQVAPAEDGSLACRARYLVTRIGADAVDVEFPALDAPQLKVRLGNHAVAWEPVPGNRNVARIPLRAAAADAPVLLEIEYRLPASTQDGRWFGLTTLYAPAFAAPVEVARLRWHLDLPPSSLGVPLAPGARPDYRWDLLRWPLCPEPGVSAAELEEWLRRSPEGADTTLAGLSFWPAGTGPQRVYHQARLRWVLFGSVILVALFLGVYFLRLSRAALVAVLGLFGLAALVLALVWPATLPGLFYGCQPGLAVIVLMLGVIWLLQERYRRQLVFIPGFTRLKAGSSLVRTGGRSSKRPREASTIDSPPADVLGPASTASKK